MLGTVAWGCIPPPECTGCSTTATGSATGATAGSGGTTGTGGTTKTGGAGGASECTLDDQCKTKPRPPCMTLVCSSGVCAEAPDDSLSPTDDGNACTTDTCVNGVETYTNNTLPCGNNPLVTHCEGGVCTGCMVDTDCDPKTECQTWTCSGDQKCIPTNGPTDLFVDPPGDCMVRSCSDGGVLVVAEDLADIPVSDNNECTKEECLGLGQPSSTPQEGQACGAGPTCMNGEAKAENTCDANGSCLVGGIVDCAPFACDATTCKTTCAGGADCTPAAYCDPGQSKCFNKKSNGTDCAAGNECASTFCAADDLVCCASACTATCKSCNAGGAPGTCGNLASGVKDKCPSGQACNSSGSCVSTNGKSIVGALCVTSADCFNYVGGGPSECVNGLCRLHVGEVCETSKPHECETNLCDALTHTCQECTTNADCPSMTCDIVNKRCYLGTGGTCGAVSDCSPGHNCTNNTCN